jgi:ABC-type lipoprotein release transport system permease subunit
MLKRWLFRSYRWLAALNQWVQRRFTRAGQLVLWLILVGTVVGVDTKFTMAYQAVAFLVCLLSVSLAWALLARGQFGAQRFLP